MSTSFSNPTPTLAPLSDEEKEELDQFLVSEATSDETMMLDTLDGYLTAIAIGPISLRLDVTAHTLVDDDAVYTG